jgi:hypothetical protein
MINMEKQSVELSFYTRSSLKNWAKGRELLMTLYEKGSMYALESIDINGTWKKIDKDTLGTLEKRWNKFNNVLFKREREYEAELAILLGGTLSGLSIVSLWVEESFFKTETRINSFLDLSLTLYDLILPEYGFIHLVRDKIDMATINDPILGKTILPINLEKGLPGIFWANFFGTKYVKLIGRKKLIAAPSYKKQEITNEGLLVITAPSPVDTTNEIYRKRQEELQDYIGLEFFYPNKAKKNSPSFG